MNDGLEVITNDNVLAEWQTVVVSEENCPFQDQFEPSNC